MSINYLDAVPWKDVQIKDGFWAARLQINRELTLNHQYNQLEETGRIDNFRHTSGKKKGKFQGRFPFNDSDVYKWLEAASHSLGTPGHPEIELALMSLYWVTGRENYLDTAKFFLDQRGKGYAGGDEYHQDHRRFTEQEEVVGHAVRAVYLMSRAADVYRETKGKTLMNRLEKLWENMVQKKMYVTGGIGSRYEGEAFGKEYELPNERAYAETCAAIGNVFWNHRMLQLTGNAQYTDIIETALYNGFLSGEGVVGSSLRAKQGKCYFE